MPEFVHRLRVRYAECDMQGHVFNANYFTWFDIAHTELWRAALGPFRGLMDAGLDIVVAEARARYRAGAHFDDDVDIAVSLAPLTTSSMTSRHRVLRDGELLTEGELRHVCVDLHTHAKRAWPDWVRAGMAAYVQE